LIVSFAVCAPEDSSEIESPYTDAYTEYEGLLYEWERGATVSFERERKEDDIVLLRE